jgi:hypothetical protein
MTKRSLSAVAIVLAALSGCAPAPRGPVAPAATPASGRADDNTWMTLAVQGARLRVPPGWRYRTEGSAIVADPGNDSAVLVFEGASSRAALEARLRTLGARHGLDRVDFGRARPKQMNGIDVLIFEDMAAESSGRAGDVFVLLGDAPSGRGVVMVFLWASDATQRHDLELIDAANTLRPI